MRTGSRTLCEKHTQYHQSLALAESWHRTRRLYLILSPDMNLLQVTFEVT